MSPAHTQTGAVGILGLQAGEDVKAGWGLSRLLSGDHWPCEPVKRLSRAMVSPMDLYCMRT